jgi:dipeptidase E
MNRHLMLLSNSTCFGRTYFEHAAEDLLDFLGPVKRVLFVPFAVQDQVTYCEKVGGQFGKLGIRVDPLLFTRASRHEAVAEVAAAIESAEAIFVGGGNTFRLIDLVHRSGALDPIRRRAIAGLPYIGSSAGTGISAPTMMTTNDMPIVEPESFRALGLVPFQLNCHYLDPDPSSRHMGETREDRIREFLEDNLTPVVGLREGSWLRVDGDGGGEGSALRVLLRGERDARILRRGLDPVEAPAGTDLATIEGVLPGHRPGSGSPGA